MDAQSNTKALSHNNCYREKTISDKYSECVSLFLPYLSGMKIV
jgi:hypothetical protein